MPKKTGRRNSNTFTIHKSCVTMYDRNGNHCLIDIDDYDRILEENRYWYASKTKSTNGKKVRVYFESMLSRKRLRLHNFIMSKKNGEIVDHINGDTTDNRKSNLRRCTKADNNKNLGLSSNNTSGVTGVYWNKRRNKWFANIGVNYKTIHLGTFREYDDAVKARKEAEENYYGEYQRNKE